MPNPVIYSKEPEDFYYMDVNVPCQSACPALTNIPAYIRALYEDQFDRSYEINRMANIFPGVLGRICSRPCETKCRHGEAELGRPVNICHIKRSAADLRDSVSSSVKSIFSPLGKSVAVIGSGPAGLAAAYDLSTIGFTVTVFEALDNPGGMLRYGIPEFRLPREILDAEIDYILGAGITLKTGIRVGTGVSMEDLMAEHDAVLVATGCYEPNPLNIPGETMPGVYSGLQFMMDICAGQLPDLGKRVLVLGAGFTAFGQDPFSHGVTPDHRQWGCGGRRVCANPLG
jgi:formate dehydrogenase major subunit